MNVSEFRYTFRDIIQDHGELWASASSLRTRILRLCHEGKVNYRQNLEALKSSMGSFERAFPIHRQLGEAVLYPFICTHIPKLYLSVDFLLVEHQEIEVKFEELKTMLQIVSAEEQVPALRIIRQIRYGLDYFICLLSSHLKIEEEKLYCYAFDYFSNAEKSQLSSEIDEKLEGLSLPENKPGKR